MEIEILKELNSFPGVKQPMSIIEIESLEAKFNAGIQFPQALRELLFLAGKNCELLAYRLDDSQEEMQDHMIEWLVEEGESIGQPFYVIDISAYPDGFLFVYTDTKEEDPIVFSANMAGVDIGRPFIESLHRTLSEILSLKIEMVESGLSTF